MTLLSHDKNLRRLAVGVATTTPNFSGIWRNQLGSEMNLIISGNDVSGKYTTTVSATATGGKLTGTISGTINGDIIAFIVNWSPIGSITTWVGQMRDDDTGNPRIDTLWHLAREVPDDEEPTGLWASILAGADTFTR